jgi:hypoxanthine-DNA glycosylase
LKKLPENKIYSFPPNSAPDAEKLILGSMPGVESLRRRQYYAYPRNMFWRIIGEIFSFPYNIAYDERLKILVKNKTALWDTVCACFREGSLDSNIKNAVPNDFESFFKTHSKIRKIIFNGQSAHKLFIRLNKHLDTNRIEMVTAPSTSPANAGMTYQEKLISWRKALN